jgi:hypothetical protein
MAVEPLGVPYGRGNLQVKIMEEPIKREGILQRKQ